MLAWYLGVEQRPVETASSSPTPAATPHPDPAAVAAPGVGRWACTPAAGAGTVGCRAGTVGCRAGRRGSSCALPVSEETAPGCPSCSVL